jgi:hypothetical protein
MHKAKRFLLVALAVLSGAAAFTAYDLNAAVNISGDDLVTLCFRGRTIGVPFYLRNRYVANGALDGPCPTSNP